MSRDTAPQNKIQFSINVKFEGLAPNEKQPDVQVYAFDSKGAFLATAPLEGNTASLAIPAGQTGSLRIFVGPKSEQPGPARVSRLIRSGSYERRVQFSPQNPKLNLVIVDAVWKRWFLCSCVVRGRLVKRLVLPDGTVRDLPVCRARVKICEVDPIPFIIGRLPDADLLRIRDDLREIVDGPWPPIPVPPPEEIGPVGPIPGPGPDPAPDFRVIPEAIRFPDVAARVPVTSRIPSMARLSAMRTAPMAAASTASVAEDKTLKQLKVMANISSLAELRKSIVDNIDIISPFICRWPWIEPFFRYRVDCIKTVNVDENGRFETTIFYPCFGDKPDLYFRAEQLRGFTWETIYERPVRCNTYWNYQCGTEVLLYVTDPSVVPCVPEETPELPEGVTTWIMPFAVGGTKIWGAPPGLPPAPNGWVRTDGFTNYSGIVEAPFGGNLGFRHGYANSIPSAAIKYYRWSYRKVGAIKWETMGASVGRHYVKESPGMLPTFPNYSLGPHTIGGNENLFEFKPVSPPGPQPGDPAGTITYWPTDDFFGDIYSGLLDTIGLPGGPLAAAGQYQIKLEVFNSMGVPVAPGAGTFKFIVPSGVAPDGITTIAREAQPTEIDGMGFVFNLQVDNNPCDATIDPPVIAGTTVPDPCGFMTYNPATATTISLSFHAKHPNNRATFSFQVVRGITPVGIASTSGETSALSSGSYTGNGSGDFTPTPPNFARTDIMETCTIAAFSLNLYVWGKATNGWTRIGYDDIAVRAFGLAPA